MLKEWFAKQKAKGILLKAFKVANLGIPHKTGEDKFYQYPKIHEVSFNYEKKYMRYTFTLPNGVDPKEVKKKQFVFQQFFGNNIEITGDIKHFVLNVYTKNLPTTIKYKYEDIKSLIEKDKIIVPIVAGYDRKGELTIYDATGSPNLLIFGEPGGGKSSILHVIHTTLMQLYSPEEMHFYMGDMKMAELPVYEGVKHVKSISYTGKELAPTLTYLRKELEKRGKILKKHRVRHVNSLPVKVKKDLPYIMLTVDEFVMIKDNSIITELLQVASLGRAYGMYVILSMQRPSHSILSTDVRALLSVRMGFKTVDKKNAVLGETPGSELLEEPGTFIFKKSDTKQLKAPYLNESAVEKIIRPYIDEEWRNHSYLEEQGLSEQKETHEYIEEDIFSTEKVNIDGFK